MCRYECHDIAIALEDIFSLRGPFGLGNDEVGLQYFKIDIITRYNVHGILVTSFNYHVMKYTEGKNFGR